MKLKLSEDPKDWRKAGVLGPLGLAVMLSLLRWRHHLSPTAWLAGLGVLACVAICALVQPRWFRGWYRATGWLAFQIGQAVGRVVFILAFFLIVTPAGLVLRLLNRDPLQLKRKPEAGTYWNKATETTPLDRMF